MGRTQPITLSLPSIKVGSIRWSIWKVLCGSSHILVGLGEEGEVGKASQIKAWVGQRGRTGPRSSREAHSKAGPSHSLKYIRTLTLKDLEQNDDQTKAMCPRVYYSKSKSSSLRINVNCDSFRCMTCPSPGL